MRERDEQGLRYIFKQEKKGRERKREAKMKWHQIKQNFVRSYHGS